MAMGGPSSAHRKSSAQAVCSTAEKRITTTAHGRIRMLITNINGLLTYSQGEDANGVSITARAYHGKWHSSDQIPVNAVPLVGFFGALNPTDGGHSQRYSLQSEWHRQGANSESKVVAYGFYYDLNLFSDFTYYLVDPIKGDQFEQQDRRWVAGLDAHHTIFSQWSGRKVENTFGLQLRNDWIHNGLYRTENRVRMDKTDYQRRLTSLIAQLPLNGHCPILPATTERDQFTDTMTGFYAENKIQWAEKFRSVAGSARRRSKYFVVTSLAYSACGRNLPANSGTATKFLPSPKLSLIFGPWSNTEFYAQGGFSFHSNDGRGATQTVEPVSPDNPYPNTPVAKIPPLVPTKGGEIGVRTAAVTHLQSTLSLWYLRSSFRTAAGWRHRRHVASAQPSNRYGIEWANYYTPTEHWALDFDLADSSAQFTEIDPDDAAYTSAGGHPCKAPAASMCPKPLSGDFIGHHPARLQGFSSSLRLRYFGPRDLTSDGIYRSNATVLLNGDARLSIERKWRISAEFLNLLNRRDSDIDYAYISRVTPTTTPAFTRVFHPVEPFQVRLALGRTF